MGRLRTFIAIELAPSVKRRAEKLIALLQESGADVSWVKPQHMHLTLKFLGEIPELEAAELCHVVTDAAKTVEPFELVFRGLGAFPTLEDPRTIWLGLESGEEELRELHGVLEDALHRDFGFSKDRRRFQPHLTLGRAKRAEGPELDTLMQLMSEQANFDGDLTVVDEVAILSSVIGRNGPTYEPLGHAELG